MKAEDINTVQTTEKLNFRDVLIMLVFVVLYACLLFFRVGSATAPQSGYIMTKDNNEEIVLRLDAEYEIAKASVYVGHTAPVYLNFEKLNSGGEVLETVNQPFKSSFYWTDIELDSKINGLRILGKNNKAQLMELVLVDKNGNTVLPVNSGEYPALFDEQNTFVAEPTYFDHTMFDEVYHARTAYEFINGYEIYEISHPHLGKSIMTLGIRLFGMTPLGWRFISVIFGLLAVPIMYLMAWHFTRKRDVTILATILLCTQFMHFTLSRIGTIDVIVSLFIMLMFYFMARFVDALKQGTLKRQYCELFLCGCAAACAVATKWTGLYAMLGIGVIFFSFLIPRYINDGWTDRTNRRLIAIGAYCVLVFVVLPLSVYILSFIPMRTMFPDKNLLQIAEASSRYMLKYHSNVLQAHPYASKIYEWIVGRGALLDARDMAGDKLSSVVTTGNPAIAFAGLAALVHNIYLWVKKKDMSAKILCIAYFAMVLPWVFISRTQFVYQYYVCTLLLGLLIANSMNCIEKGRRKKIIIAAVISAVFFIVYYPILSGLPVNPGLYKYFMLWS